MIHANPFCRICANNPDGQTPCRNTAGGRLRPPCFDPPPRAGRLWSDETAELDEGEGVSPAERSALIGS